MSRSESKPDSASLRAADLWLRGNEQVAKLPKRTKPVIDGVAMGESSHRACRGGWGQRATKEWSGTWETRFCGWNPTPTTKT